MPSALNLSRNEDQYTFTSGYNKSNINPVQLRSSSDHNLHIDGPKQSEATTSNQANGSFQPAPLLLKEGEANIGIYIPALQVMMKNV